MQDIGCRPTASKSKLRFESVEFPDIPGQSALFLRYQSDPASLRKYYPSVPAPQHEVSHRVDEVLGSYVVDREQLCTVLDEQNRGFKAREKTFQNIDLLRRPNTVAVLTGQQTGLFTGPLYTIYKALSTIRMSECLRERGVDAVPVFWAATEDHDFDEIARAYAVGRDGAELEFHLPPNSDRAGHPVGTLEPPANFASMIVEQLAGLPDTEFSEAVRLSLTQAWGSGRTIGEAFCTQLQQIFREYGLIVVDPIDARLKRLSLPVFSAAVENAGELAAALLERSTELAADGFHAQVLVTPDHFPAFYQTDDGVRRAIRRDSSGRFRVTGTRQEFSAAELIESAAANPERLSAGVMLRPVVQDYLFPTICYFGGGGEIAYFAQNSEVYRILGRPVTPILHRQSFTIVEAKHARTLEKYELEFGDLFNGLESLLPGIVARFVDPGTSRKFADAEGEIDTELNRLNEELSRIDPTLAANLATRRRKILYHIAAVRKKFQRVQIERDETVKRQLESLFASLLPHGGLQERRLNLVTFTARYGEYFIDWLYDSIELEERGHRLLYL